MRIGEVLRWFRRWRERFPIFLVGGVVRDWLLYGEDKAIEDCDVVLLGDLRGLREMVGYLEREGAKLKKFSRFGTAEMTFRGLNLDVALSRRERYAYPGALPEVEFTDSLLEDSRRRDFTVNALYYDGKEVIDFHGGLKDLKDRVLRPIASFGDDPTRGIRGVRYRYKLGFSYHPSFFVAVREAARYIENVSYQRVINELRLTAVLPRRVLLGALRDAVRFKLLRTILKGEPALPRRVYLGRPSPSRWVIPLGPFLKESLPLNREERRALKVKGSLEVKGMLTAHLNMSRWRDIEVLTYMTWWADEDERDILRTYLKVRNKVKVKMYPIGERRRTAEESMRALGLEGKPPEECLKEPPTPKDRQTYRLMCEGRIMEMFYERIRR